MFDIDRGADRATALVVLGVGLVVVIATVLAVLLVVSTALETRA